MKGTPLNRTTKVGSFTANKLGFHDMHGNVWQWCDDPIDVKGGAARVVRGGSWRYDGLVCRAANRSGYVPSFRNTYLGFRLARVPLGSK
jgi:formylglycine-generating enzyme required for sulfatase activity